MRRLLFLLLFLQAIQLNASFTSDTARAYIGGDLARLPITVSTDDSASYRSFEISGYFKLSNPTVFYPENFAIVDTLGQVDNIDLHNVNLLRLNDSIYEFKIFLSFHGQAQDYSTYLYLDGTALAGSDSICLVYFDSLVVNNKPNDAAIGTVITESIGTPLPYVRFAVLEPNYPNPVNIGQTTSWAYKIDKNSDVKFYIYDNAGQRKQIGYYPNQSKGVHVFKYTPEFYMCAGGYLIVMETNSGVQTDHFMIIK